MYYSAHHPSPVGELVLVSDGAALVGLWIAGQKYFGKTIPTECVERRELPVLGEGKRWLDDYFAGKKPQIARLPLAPLGGAFRQMVWQILIGIPYGEVTTYGQIAQEVARRMGKARMSSQAVGGAVGHNAISIIIPCHRVVGAHGNLTGYAGGIDLKVRLLQHEGVDMSEMFVPTKGTAL